jgi:hypothetical protein
VGNDRNALVPQPFEPAEIVKDPVRVRRQSSPPPPERRDIHPRPEVPAIAEGKLVRDPSPTPPINMHEGDKLSKQSTHQGGQHGQGRKSENGNPKGVTTDP